MMIIYKKLFAILLIASSIIGSSFDSSIYDKQKLANSYSESNLYEDAIIIYEEILQIQEDVLGDADLNLLNTVSKLYELYIHMNDTENVWRLTKIMLLLHQ